MVIDVRQCPQHGARTCTCILSYPHVELIPLTLGGIETMIGAYDGTVVQTAPVHLDPDILAYRQFGGALTPRGIAVLLFFWLLRVWPPHRGVA